MTGKSKTDWKAAGLILGHGKVFQLRKLQKNNSPISAHFFTISNSCERWIDAENFVCTFGKRTKE